jgi:hypothetical protein
MSTSATTPPPMYMVYPSVRRVLRVYDLPAPADPCVLAGSDHPQGDAAVDSAA